MSNKVPHTHTHTHTHTTGNRIWCLPLVLHVLSFDWLLTERHHEDNDEPLLHTDPSETTDPIMFKTLWRLHKNRPIQTHCLKNKRYIFCYNKSFFFFYNIK